MFSVLVRLSLLIAAVRSASPENGGHIVTTPLGRVAGHHIMSYEGRTALAFEGVPYGKPPVGSRRFQAPQSAGSWSDVLVANKTYVCAQYHHLLKTTVGTEDCLYMYVYVPRVSITGEENLDVVVRIHSNLYQVSDPQASDNPHYLLDRDLVVVTFNYRLGVLGFLSTGDDIAPGNNGLKDQTMALKWVSENIKSFGGNPKSITLTGFSDGATSVHYHYLSPLSKGLFHRGLSQSGTALSPSTLSEKHLNITQTYAEYMKCNTGTSKSMLECLQNIAVANVYKPINGSHDIENVQDAFGPVVEKGPNSFLPDHPYKLILAGKVHDLPWIASNVKDEGVTILRGGLMPTIISQWSLMLPAILLFTVNDADKKNVEYKIGEKYLNNERPSLDNLDKLQKLITDRLYLIPTDNATHSQTKVCKSPVYYYSFEYSLELAPMSTNRVPGVGHGDDAILLFNSEDNPRGLAETDKKMKNAFIDFMYAFASTGVPTFKGVAWKPVTAEDINYMHIGSPNDVQMKSKKELAPREFWNSLPIKPLLL